MNQELIIVMAVIAAIVFLILFLIVFIVCACIVASQADEDIEKIASGGNQKRKN